MGWRFKRPRNDFQFLKRDSYSFADCCLKFFPAQEILFGFDQRRTIGLVETLPKTIRGRLDRTRFVKDHRCILIQRKQIVRAWTHEWNQIFPAGKDFAWV